MQNWHTLHFSSQIDKTCRHITWKNTLSLLNLLPLKMPRLSNKERNRARRRTVRDGRCTCVWLQQTIINLRTRLHQTGSVADRPRSVPRRVPSQREDLYIRLRHLRDRFATATSTSMELLGGRVTAQTIRNRLRTAGLRARRP